MANKGASALKEMGRISLENENSDMTLDEINAEITKARENRDSKNGVGTD